MSAGFSLPCRPLAGCLVPVAVGDRTIALRFRASQRRQGQARGKRQGVRLRGEVNGDAGDESVFNA